MEGQVCKEEERWRRKSNWPGRHTPTTTEVQIGLKTLTELKSTKAFLRATKVEQAEPMSTTAEPKTSREDPEKLETNPTDQAR